MRRRFSSLCLRTPLLVSSALALMLGTLAGFAASAPSASATTTTVVVNQSDLISPPVASPAPGQFDVINQGDSTGSVSLVTGPGSAPNGVGSLQLSTTDSGSHWSVYTDDWSGTALSAITSLSYTTYTTNGGPSEDPVLQLVIDPGTASSAGTSAGCPTFKTYSTLNFEPYLQSTAEVDGSWQSWDVLAAGDVVWGTGLTSCTPRTYSGSGGVSWSTFLTYYPGATVLPVASGGGVGINVGSGWYAMIGNVSTLTVGSADANTITYDFEPGIGPPTSKDQCKDGGWMTFTTPKFKNQGDCVSYVATGGRNPGNG